MEDFKMRSFSLTSEDTIPEVSHSHLNPSALNLSVAIHSYIAGNSPRARRGSIGLGDFPIRRKSSVRPDDPNLSRRERTRIFVKRLFRRKNLERTFPILKWAPEYNLQKLVADTIAGITVAITVLPQALAYSTVAGLPPIYGLYSSFVGPFVYIIFGSTAAINVGPAAIQSIVTYKYTVGKPPEYAVFLCFVTAVFTLTLGILRIEIIAHLLSAPVISAFTSAVALTIIATQLKPLLGLSFPSEEFVETLQGLTERFGDIKQHDAILGLVCCIVLILMKYLQKIFRCVTKKFPLLDKILWFFSVAKSAMVMLASCLVVAHWYPDQPFSIVGHISPGLPQFQLPPFEIYNPQDNRTHTFTEILKEEASALVVVPLLGIIGHCTIAKVVAGPERVDAAQEILVLGISNAIACFFSSMPIGGSFSRTTVNLQSGVKTPLCGLITGSLVILALEFLTPYFLYIPKASIAAVICVSCLFMVNPYIMLPLWRSKKMDLIPWAVTFLTTLFAGLEYGIAIGILISALFLLFYSARPRIKVGMKQTPKGTLFMYILLDRSLTFPSVDYISNQIIKAARDWASTDTPIVIDCHHIHYGDFSAAEGMRDLIAKMNNLGYQVFFWKLKPSVFRVITGTMKNSDVPLVHCNKEEELHSVIDGVHRRLSIFHPFIVKDGIFHYTDISSQKKSVKSVSAVSTGVFI